MTRGPHHGAAAESDMKKKENPRYHVLSVRVSREDREAIEKFSKEVNMKVSDLMREALQDVVPWQSTS